MRFHPAVLMLMVWGGAHLAFFVLPFEMVTRRFDPIGFLILLAFLGTFCAGAYIQIVWVRFRPVTPFDSLPMGNADLLLKALASVTILVFAFEIIRGSSLDLVAAYEQRSNQAQALLHGGLSGSSSLFKLGFLTYTASYVYTVRAIIFDRKPKLLNLAIFGFLPVLLAGLALGGRAQIFNSIAYAGLAILARKYLYPKKEETRASRKSWRWSLARILGVVFVVLAFNYFVNVFIIRADVVGGAEMMLQIVAHQWGVTFSGPGADFMIAAFGAVTTYIIFVFVWYLVQGVVMANSLFVSYQGDALWGVYGLDLLSAVVRRLDPEGVADSFNYLLALDTYGFLPSAFGSLYVDFLFGALVVVFAWGWLAGLVYKQIRRGEDARWYIFGPFVVMGIIFSLVNTPIGFANGLVTHFWLVVTFLMMPKPGRQDVPAGAVPA
ncbi:hypothetical protein KUW14_17270 [Pseudooceanicola nitratireducens]|uniref:hypothetical protein n=1 Tax=Pseudooceanicola nitratireducens TaxID=517719 RepID=UPI001C974691|nr:hypothetical protein [Pseudooceanicola nitratireducens]MBY6167607.1 hypothetical protein [Pseudooceanicola nitratireducens]